MGDTSTIGIPFARLKITPHPPDKIAPLRGTSSGGPRTRFIRLAKHRVDGDEMKEAACVLARPSTNRRTTALELDLGARATDLVVAEDKCDRVEAECTDLFPIDQRVQRHV